MTPRRAVGRQPSVSARVAKNGSPQRSRRSQRSQRRIAGANREEVERRGRRGTQRKLRTANLCVPQRTLRSNPCASSVISVTSVVNLRFNAQLGGLTPCRSPKVRTKLATPQTTAVRDATESPAGIDGRTEEVVLLPKQGPEAAGRSAALSSSAHTELKSREDRQGSC